MITHYFSLRHYLPNLMHTFKVLMEISTVLTILLNRLSIAGRMRRAHMRYEIFKNSLDCAEEVF